MIVERQLNLIFYVVTWYGDHQIKVERKCMTRAYLKIN